MTRPLIKTTGVTLDTAKGGKGYERTDKGELFVATVSSFANPPARGGGPNRSQHSERVRELTEKVTLDDPAWVLRFDRWLRDEGNVRTATIEVACAFVHSRLEAGVKDETGPGPATGLNRTAINVACLRADEPAKVIEHWRATYGRKLPMPVKRGVADAVRRLYDERSALKYDNLGDSLRMGDVIELVHPSCKDPAQGALYEYLINRRHGWKDSSYLYPLLPMVESAERLRAMPRDKLRELLIKDPAWLKDAGMTWENLSTLGPMDRDAWEAVIPSMGYMALLRNLRNFDQAGISRQRFLEVEAILSDPAKIERSRQFPFRFFSAWKVADSRWAPALETALDHSLRNIPKLSGNTLIMVDCSGSMYDPVSDRAKLRRYEQASVFGVALSRKCEKVRLVRYGDTYEDVKWQGSVLETVGREFPGMGGTATASSVQQLLREDESYDRIVILTDEQADALEWGTRYSVGDVVPDDIMLYTWNLAGHAVAHSEATPSKHTFAGLTDQCFKLIPLIESGTTTSWPF